MKIALVMAGFRNAMMVETAGRRLADACERISGFLSGRAVIRD